MKSPLLKRKKGLSSHKKKMPINRTTSKGTSKVVRDSNKKIGIKSRTASTVFVKSGGVETSAAKRRASASKRIDRTIKKAAGPGAKSPKTTGPIKVISPTGKAHIKRNRLGGIPKIGPSTMQQVSISKKARTFKGLKSSKRINPSKKINRGPAKR